jgi:hypothetical protein
MSSKFITPLLDLTILIYLGSANIDGWRIMVNELILLPLGCEKNSLENLHIDKCNFLYACLIHFVGRRNICEYTFNFGPLFDSLFMHESNVSKQYKSSPL